MSDSAYKHGQFCWNELATTDPARAREFYVAIAGWGLADKPMPPPMAGSYTLFQIDGKDIAGMYRLAGPQFEGVPSHWMSYVWVDDVDASSAKIRELGGTLLAEPMDIPEVGRMAIAHDPTGGHFAVFKGGQHPGAACFGGPASGSFCWNECLTRDVDEATAFYTDLFGWTADVQDMGPDHYTIFRAHDLMIGGLMAMPPMVPAEVPSHWMAYIEVDDCDARVPTIEKMGGQVLMPPTDVPNIGRFCTLQDPTGAAISIIKLIQPEG